MEINWVLILNSFIISVTGYVIVFTALVFLNWIFNIIPKLSQIKIAKKFKKEGEKSDRKNIPITGEINAAISAAIFLYFNELHDEESHEMTIKRITKIYSPWNSKIYNVNIIKR